VIPETGDLRLQVNVSAPDDSGRWPFGIYAAAAGDEQQLTRYAGGYLTEAPNDADLDLHIWPPAGAEPLVLDGFYRNHADNGLEYGPAFQCLRAAWRRGDEVFAEAALADREAIDVDRYGLHPALLDAALQAATLGPAADDRIRLPFSWNQVNRYASGATTLRVRIQPDGGGAMRVSAATPDGVPVFVIGSVSVRPLHAEALTALPHRQDSLFRVEWTPAAVPAAAPSVWVTLDGGRGDLGGVVSSEYVSIEAIAQVVAAGAVLPNVVVADLRDAREPVGPRQVRELTTRALDLVHAWLAAGELAPSRLIVLTSGAVAGTGPSAGTAPDPAGAAVWGLVRSAQSENPGSFVLVDLDEHPDSRRRLVAAVAVGEPQLAIRSGAVSVPRLVRAEAVAGAGTGAGVSLDATGTVLITGGAGALGGLAARHLAAAHGVRRLLLVSRRGSEGPGVEQLSRELAELSAELTVLACDVGDRDSLAAVLAGIPADRPLRGVIHTAGVLDDGVISALTPERLENVYRSKVDGAWHLHELTRDTDLAMFVLYSSIAGTVGSPGQASYAAANAFLDALAESRREQGLPATSLAWGLWEADSDLTGHLTDVDNRRMARSGMVPLPADEGMELFDSVLGRSSAAMVAAKLDLASLRQVATSDDVPPMLRRLVRRPRRTARGVGGSGVGELVGRLVGLGELERVRVLVDVVGREAAAVLGHGEGVRVDGEQVFRDAGFDSLAGVELRNRLAVVTGVRLPATVVFDFATPVALAEHLAEQLAPSSADGIDDDHQEMALRRVLASVPLSRFRELGILDPLLRLADTADAGDTGADGGADASADEAESIRTMDVDSLVARALGTEMDGDHR
jgi:NADP-dependent 3-hydroxy acid dehydrogenase YdfG